MGQITSGVRAILSIPQVYSFFQVLMGAHKSRQRFVDRYVRPFPGMRILDVGCGPADILAYLPGVEYWGFDISAAYISKASKKYGDLGRFFCKQLQVDDLQTLPRFDVVMAQGVLHHLDDQMAVAVMYLARQALRPDGRFITVDPCFDPTQSPIAKFLISKDRGQNVRDKEGYARLARATFPSSRLDVRHQTWIPYTHCFLECSNTSLG